MNNQLIGHVFIIKRSKSVPPHIIIQLTGSEPGKSQENRKINKLYVLTGCCLSASEIEDRRMGARQRIQQRHSEKVKIK